MDVTRAYTVAEAAELLGMTPDKVYRRITRGDLKASQVRVRNLHYRISGRDLQEYIDAGDSDELSPPVSGPTDMIGAPEAARLTGFTVETIRRMCREGKLPCVRGAGLRPHLRIPRDAVTELLNPVQ